MKNVLVMYFENETSAIIKNLKTKKICNVVEWIGESDDCSMNIKQLFNYERFLIDQYKHYDKDIYKKIHDQFLTYFIFQNRLKKIYYKSYKFYDHLDFFNMYFQKFYEILTLKQVDIVILPNLPHLGIDFIVYKLAKLLNIRTIVFSQSLFPNRFFYVEDIDDFGIFSSMKELAVENIKINKTHKKELFYMQKKPFWKNFKLTLLPETIKKQIKQAKRISYDRRYRQNLKKAISKNVDLEKKFVYFPLHLQPELATSALGGIYLDQALALERLSELLSDDWYIYVKENPKQKTEYMRGMGFFRRLKAITNLKIVPNDTDTYLLIEKCMFVATITGTAGWEAITGGKNALIFGDAWYKELPGVFSYNSDFDINQILKYRINHSDLEMAVSSLLNRMPHGVVDPEYSVIVKDYDPEKNCRIIADFIGNIIQK